MSKYQSILGSSSTAQGLGRAGTLVAAMTPPAKKDVGTPPAPSAKTTMKLATTMVPGLAVGGVGAYMWKKHRVLGFLAGHALGSNAKGVWDGGSDRRKALGSLAVEGAGVGGALMWKKHPVLGFLAGSLTGVVASVLVPGTYAHDEWVKWRAKK